MACNDVLSLQDLQTAKKHDIFHNEVITGKAGGVAGGDDIDYATNQVTGQTQKTLPAVLRDIGFRPAPFTFTTGGNLEVGDSDMAVLWPVSDGGDGDYYIWKGAYPKVIPSASSPTTTGGVSASGWLPFGDITLRSDLASPAIGKGVELVYGAAKSANFDICKTLTELQASLTEKRSARLISSVITPTTGLPVPSFAVLEMENSAIGFIGSTFLSNNTISKTGNATVTLTNQDPDAGAATVDAVVYQDPSWPSGAVYPQKSTFRGVGIKGNTTTPNEAGIFILQGGVLTIDSVDVVNCVNGLLAKVLFLSTINKLHTLGKIRIDSGTSVTMTDCWARGSGVREGAFDLNGLKYSAMNGCASDTAPNTAYAFQACQSLTLNGCGCEGAEASTGNRGSALAFKDDNTIIVNGFSCVPIDGQAAALITVGNNNRIEMHGWDSNFGQNNSTDIYVYGNGSILEIFSSKFYGDRAPVIQIAVGSTSTVVWHRPDGNTVKYFAPSVPGSAAIEVFFDHGTWTPALNFASGTSGISYASRSGTWEKNGSQITLHGSLALSSKGSSTGVAYITGNTFLSGGYEAVKPNLISGVSGGPFTMVIDNNAQAVFILLDGATGTSNATDANMSNTTSIRFTIRFTLSGSRFS